MLKSPAKRTVSQWTESEMKKVWNIDGVKHLEHVIQGNNLAQYGINCSIYLKYLQFKSIIQARSTLNLTS